MLQRSLKPGGKGDDDLSSMDGDGNTSGHKVKEKECTLRDIVPDTCRVEVYRHCGRRMQAGLYGSTKGGVLR